MNQLAFEVHVYKELKERIKRDFLFDNDDDSCLTDTVNGECSLEESILAIVREIKRTEAFATAIKFIISDNNARLERFEHKAARLRKTVMWALQETGLKKVEAADTTVSQREGEKGIVITNEAAIPHNYCQVKYLPSKTKIRNALELGNKIPGVEWSNAQPILTIRTR